MNLIWDGILLLRDEVKRHQLDFQFCYLNYQTGAILINRLPANKDDFVKVSLSSEQQQKEKDIPTIWIENFAELHFHNPHQLSEELILFLKKYLLFPFLSLKAHHEKRAISVAHLAQTIDGKIATSLGHSKWIGNQENLIHAHRMRALCDGILVGSRTLAEDQPKLTVRHVKGTDPIRIIIGNPAPHFESLLNTGTSPVFVLHNKAIAKDPSVQYFHLSTANTPINPKEVLAFLYNKGIQTVYIEGGAKTISYFFENLDIDILQLHLAPMVFGSGTAGLQMPNVQKMEEAYTFNYHHFLPIGDAMMFTGFQ